MADEQPRDTLDAVLERTSLRRTFDSPSAPSVSLLWADSLLSYAALQMTNVARPWLPYGILDVDLVLGLVAEPADDRHSFLRCLRGKQRTGAVGGRPSDRMTPFQVPVSLPRFSTHPEA